MSNLRDEAVAVKWRIDSASTALSNLQSEAQRDIGGELRNLHGALISSSTAIRGVLHKHKRRHFSLALLRTQSQEAVALQRFLDDVVGRLDVATQSASRSHAQSQSYYLQALDLPNTHIQPARDSVQALRNNISYAQYRLDVDLESTKTLAADAQRQLTRVGNDIAQKERNIATSRQKSQNNSDEMARLRREQDAIEHDRKEKAAQAARLRQVSQHISRHK
jgi:chromosome segregation ATPase